MVRWTRVLAVASLTAAALAIVPTMAWADDFTSFAGTMTADSVLGGGLSLLHYFWPVVTVVLGIFFAIWGVEWIIATVKKARGK